MLNIDINSLGNDEFGYPWMRWINLEITWILIKVSINNDQIISDKILNILG